ncbi:cytoskeleton protein RodZ [Pseudomonas fluvialis]|uniref:Cytoskeleton protein RodZ n=1 Tax=Pseudomonas fluvialis TaxID=1793966 RepID=A0A7X0BSM8_9PSED|nr:RodZ family helix-turn-helix domain-containing protein [Pseudomonas fluvialis]MBB6341551.1 cytoskeleton protein RodZ [Pseudomonas fluvialis]
MNASPSDVLAAVQINPGQTLRMAREAKGMEVADAARSLNMSESMLRNVEAGAFDKLNGHTFARGYVRAYAKLLGLDQEQLVTAFDRYTGTDATGSEVRTLGRLEEPVRVSQNLMRMLSVAVLAGGALLTYLVWPEKAAEKAVSEIGIEHVEVESADGTTQIHLLDEPEDQAVAEANKPAEVEPVPAAAELSAPASPAVAAGEITAPLASAASVPAVPVTPAAATPAAAVPPAAAPVVPDSAPAAPVAAAPLATQPPVVQAVPAGQALVQVQFSADCWTQLTDADGKVLFSALKRKGDTLELAGKPPFELRLGYARGAQVSLNGQPVDVAPFTSGETARMKLGQ